MSKAKKAIVTLTPEQFQLLECKTSKKKVAKQNSKLQDCLLYMLKPSNAITPFFFNYILATHYEFSKDIEKVSTNGNRHIINPDWFISLETI